jgi:hypothetical protein
MDFMTSIENSYLGGLSVMMLKGVVGLTLYSWVRATYPRFRYDQLMNLGWKFLLPVATGNLIVTATWIMITKVYGAAPGWMFSFGLYAVAVAVFVLLRSKKSTQYLDTRSVDMINQPARRTVDLVESKPEEVPA